MSRMLNAQVILLLIFAGLGQLMNLMAKNAFYNGNDYLDGFKIIISDLLKMISPQNNDIYTALFERVKYN